MAWRVRHGPGQPLDRFPVSPSPCLLQRTYFPPGKKKARTNVAALKKPPWGEVEER